MRSKSGTIMAAVLPLIAVLALGVTVASANPQNDMVSKTKMDGPFNVTLKVLPAEAFNGMNAEMTWDGGASSVNLSADPQPNHHMVVFVERDGEPVEHATVEMRYRPMQSGDMTWQSLPVARMHASGKGMETTHFGNNLELDPGRYDVEVTIDGSTTTFEVTV
ncbi:MAG: hypothetical protein PVJ49_02720 [Acidobacteriota bacterium]|jgi:hypothetical protein